MRWFPFLLALGCGANPPSGEPQPELRTWQLPSGYAPRLVEALQRALHDQNHAKASERAPLGSAQEGPGGSLVVVAPPGILDGVDALVARVIAEPAAPLRRNVEVEYWVVQGIPAAAPSRGPGLDEVGPALDAVQQTDGPMALSLLARRRLRTLDAGRGQVEDDTVSITQTVGIEPGAQGIVADVRVKIPFAWRQELARYGQGLASAEVATRLSLEPGTVAVLSQAGFPSEQGPSSLYVLVRPTIAE